MGYCRFIVAGLVVIASVLLIKFPRTVMLPATLLTKDLSGQVWLVSGGNVGIGYETAVQLAKQGATVVVGCRNESRASDAVQRAALEGVQLQPMNLDLGDFDSIRRFAAAFAAQYSSLDGLVANAGVMVPPLARTAQGHESQWGTNHLGHVLLVDLLLPQLESTGTPSRVVVVSSRAGELVGAIDFEDPDYNHHTYNAIVAYAASKYANVLFTKVLASRLTAKHSNVLAYSLHPGAVLTELLRHIPFADTIVPLLQPLLLLIMKTPWEGAQTSLYACLADGIPSGAYLSECSVVEHVLADQMDAVAETLWVKSRSDVGLPPWE